LCRPKVSQRAVGVRGREERAEVSLSRSVMLVVRFSVVAYFLGFGGNKTTCVDV
jgi:hypothetical protein